MAIYTHEFKQAAKKIFDGLITTQPSTREVFMV